MRDKVEDIEPTVRKNNMKQHHRRGERGYGRSNMLVNIREFSRIFQKDSRLQNPDESQVRKIKRNPNPKFS